MKVYHHSEPFTLECGAVLPTVDIAYHTYGVLGGDGSNVLWICHALTANSDVATWWGGLVGGGAAIDPARHFIVCANILASPYGSTGPLSTDPATGAPYGASFPPLTIRDMVGAHELLAEHLGISSIALLVGGSMGGYQALEWCILAPQRIRRLFLIATSATESPWGIAVHAAQRLAIEADSTFRSGQDGSGSKGLGAARAIGMLMYRSYQTYALTQSEKDSEKTDHYKAASYIDYQAQKFTDRFDAQSYWVLTKALDSHHIARGRGGSPEEVLKNIQQPTLIIGITSDLLCPLREQAFLAEHIPAATFVPIDSAYGHDGFLVEAEAIGRHLDAWMEGKGKDELNIGGTHLHHIKREIGV